MANFIAIELIDSLGKAAGVRYINLDCVCRADHIIGASGNTGEMEITLVDGFKIKANPELADSIALHFIAGITNPQSQAKITMKAV